MRVYRTYVCDICGKESPIQEDIELCEGIHAGLNSIAEVREYKALTTNARQAISMVLSYNNDRTRTDVDVAINKMLQFEEIHKMKV